MNKRYEIVTWKPPREAWEDVFDEYIRREELAARCEIHPEAVDLMVSLGIAEPVTDSPHQLFDDGAVYRIRKALRMRRDLGVNYVSAGIILDLLEEIDSLKRRISEIESGADQ